MSTKSPVVIATLVVLLALHVCADKDIGFQYSLNIDAYRGLYSAMVVRVW